MPTRHSGKKGGKKAGKTGGEEGETTGMIHAILAVLKPLGPIPAELEQKIRDQKDRAVLTGWLNHAVRAGGIKEFMGLLGD